MFPGTEWGMFGACEDEAVAERDRSRCDGTKKWNGGRSAGCDVAGLTFAQ